MDRPRLPVIFASFWRSEPAAALRGFLKGRGPLQFLLRAQLLESLVRHIDLAAHLQKLRRIFQRLGDAFDCPDVLGHILAYHAVAAGGRPGEFSVLILQTAGKAVDLDLDTYSGSMLHPVRGGQSRAAHHTKMHPTNFPS